MVAGDPERLHEKMTEQDGGITYHCSIIDAMVINPNMACLPVISHVDVSLQDRIATETKVRPMARTIKQV